MIIDAVAPPFELVRLRFHAVALVPIRPPIARARGAGGRRRAIARRHAGVLTWRESSAEWRRA